MRLARVAAALLRPLALAIHWLPLLAVTPVVPALAGLFRAIEGELPPDAALLMLRVGGVLLGAAAAFALADPMAGSTAAVPTPRWLRQWLRTALALGYAAAAWAVTYRLVAAWSEAAPPWWDITAEAAVCVMAGLAGAAFAIRRAPERHAATAGAATLSGLVLGSLFLPGRWSPWPSLGEAGWDAAHAGWLAALPVALAAVGIAHRDTRRNPWRRAGGRWAVFIGRLGGSRLGLVGVSWPGDKRGLRWMSHRPRRPSTRRPRAPYPTRDLSSRPERRAVGGAGTAATQGQETRTSEY